MKYPPLYPDYREATPPAKKRWGIIWIISNMLCVLTTLWLWPAEKPVQAVQFWILSIVVPSFFIGLLFAVRFWVFQVASGNQQTYRHIIRREEAVWWRQRSLGLPIEPWCLLGPAGDRPEHHIAALNRNNLPPKAILDWQGSQFLRCPQILEKDIFRRESALSQYLMRTLLEIYSEKSALPPIFQTLYWCGSAEVGQKFMQALIEKGWQFKQPLSQLNDVEQLDVAIDRYHHSGNKDMRSLYAGVYCTACPNVDRTAGEAAFVWCSEDKGKVIVQRAERQDTPEETVDMITGRIEKLTKLTAPPEYCILFNKRAAETLQSGRWSTLEHILAPFWGDLKQISPLIAITMAAFWSLETEQPCGWIDQDNECNAIIGVINVGK